ncbi:hypothetical protein [Sterolibacterium denitrificans]|uniref:hypothetical protein n=1 Tax=Sterolibacterium denitrificans TaxID=157592 RepID=UPI0012B68F74|nr:hypothetical protein [Sterolibacterium denitrificans]
MLADLDEKRERELIQELPETTEIRQNLHADLVLEHLEKTHGLLIENYEVFHSDDGRTNIRCDKRIFDVVAFMAHEMHMKTNEFMPILRYLYNRQLINRTLYLLNRINSETTKIAMSAENANQQGVINDARFREVLEQLKALKAEITAQTKNVLD